MKPVVENLVLVDRNSIFDRVGGNSKVGRAKSQDKTDKSNNMV